MLARTLSATTLGVRAHLISVEVDVSDGLPGLTIVGLPDACVRESRDRIRAALKNSGFAYPARRTTVNLAPADLPKQGTEFDLAIAVAFLAATGQIPAGALEGRVFKGELALDGRLRAGPGLVPLALDAGRDRGLELVIPRVEALEGIPGRDIRGFAFGDLVEVVDHLTGDAPGEPLPCLDWTGAGPDGAGPDLSMVRGHIVARRSLEIAAAGGHNLLLVGPPGSGKTTLATALPGLLPPMDESEMLEVTRIYSVAGQLAPGCPIVTTRPFRAPHHTASEAALVGGGRIPAPGEVTLAHRGILFLDELPEFRRSVLEVLRQPLESGSVLVSRAGGRAEFPSRALLVGAMNPCPCGYRGDPVHLCRCPPAALTRYRSRISGPFLDRLDLHVAVDRVPLAEFDQGPGPEDSASVRARVLAAHLVQLRRFQGTPTRSNAAMTPAQVEEHCHLLSPDRRKALQVAETLGLTARGWRKVLTIARTLADLEGSPSIERGHLIEAIGYRSLNTAGESALA